MVDLVLEGSSFETIGRDDAIFALGGTSPHDDPTRATDVSGEVGNAKAPLSANLAAGGFDDNGIDQDHEAVAGRRLLMLAHVDGYDPAGDADLWGGESDAGRRCAHGLQQVGDQSVIGNVTDFRGTFLQHLVR